MDTTKESKKKWGDIIEGEESYNAPNTPVSVEGPDDKGMYIKTYVEYTKNEKGQAVKIIKKVKSYKKTVPVCKKVIERRGWKKFGECRNAPPGPEEGITSVGEETFITPTKTGFEKEEELETTAPTGKELNIKCRRCGKEGHWTTKCPYASAIPILSKTTEESQEKKAGKYLPPGRREGAAEAVNTTLRVTNITEDAKESDILELFKRFGPIQRVYLARDKHTSASKGFAFVSFHKRDDAARAIQKLNGFGYDHLILNVEWARPSQK
jgi:translation initiation factor 3 subunit G